MIGIFLIGLLVGLGLFGLFSSVRASGKRVAWYEVLFTVLGLGLIGFGVWNYFGSLAEYAPQAATANLLIFGIPGLILAAFVLFRVQRRKSANA